MRTYWPAGAVQLKAAVDGLRHTGVQDPIHELLQCGALGDECEGHAGQRSARVVNQTGNRKDALFRDADIHAAPLTARIEFDHRGAIDGESGRMEPTGFSRNGVIPNPWADFRQNRWRVGGPHPVAREAGLKRLG